MLKKIVAIASIALILWMGASWAEICGKNLKINPEYSKYNFWVNTVELFEERGWVR